MGTIEGFIMALHHRNTQRFPASFPRAQPVEGNVLRGQRPARWILSRVGRVVGVIAGESHLLRPLPSHPNQPEVVLSQGVSAQKATGM